MRVSPAAVLALCLLAGCPGPLKFGIQGQLTDPAQALSALRARSAKLLGLRGEGRVSIRSFRGNGTTGVVLAAIRPDKLRFEVDDFFGNPSVLLVSDGALLGLYRASSNEFALGDATPAHVAEILPAEVGLPEIVGVLFGDPVVLGDSPSALTLDRGSRSYALTFQSANRKERIDLDTETLLPLRVRVEGQGAYEARFDDWGSSASVPVPRRVGLGSSQGEATLTYRTLEINPVLPEALFVPRSPAGAREMRFSN